MCAAPADDRCPATPLSIKRWCPRVYSAAVIVVSLILWACCFGLYTQHHDVLPSRFHPDEPGKALQIIENNRNFNHPQLMLELTQWAVALTDTPREQEAVTQVGRLVIAGLAAMAVVALALTGLVLRGWAGFIGVAVVTALCPPWIMYAHYFKEDPALIMGLAVSLLALAWFWRCRCTSALVLAGIGCGLAASGKYVGIIALPWVLICSIIPPRQGFWWHRLTRWPIIVSWTILTLLLINWRAINEWEPFYHAMSNEAEHGVTAHSGVTGYRPNWYWAVAVWRDLTWPIATLAGWYVLRLVWLTVNSAWRAVRSRRAAPDEASERRTSPVSLGGELTLALFVPVYFIMMLYSPLPFNRYILPVTVLVYALAGLGVADLAIVISGLRPWRRGDAADARPTTAPHRRMWVQRVALAAALTPVLVVHLPRAANYLSQFPQDSRLRLEAWVLANIPPGSRLVQDYYAGLPRWSYHNPSPAQTNLTILPTGFMAAEIGDRDRGRRYRPDYIIVADSAYGRYMTPWLQAAPGHDRSFEQYRAFYQRLFHEGELVWDSMAQTHHHPSGTWTNPRLRVYRLPRQ